MRNPSNQPYIIDTFTDKRAYFATETENDFINEIVGRLNSGDEYLKNDLGWSPSRSQSLPLTSKMNFRKKIAMKLFKQLKIIELT